MRVGLIADDVTGAGDASVQFARRGWETFLSLHTAAAVPLPDGLSVIATTTDSRALGDEVAHTLTHDAVARLSAAGVDRVFLKIDSTMRGSVHGQITGALHAWQTHYPRARAIVCPAYPRMGRTIRDGRLLVNGEPVERTAIGRDPVTPVTTSDMHVLLPASSSIAVADAESDADLASLAAAIAAEGPSAIAVGSGGLAEALADALSSDPQAGGRRRERFDRAWRAIGERRKARILLLVSSLNPASHAQTERLRRTFPDVAVVLAPVERVENALMAERLADQFGDLVARERWDAVGLIGGDGARAALTRIGASGIQIVDSLVEGIPVGVIAGGVADGLLVFTKAGGFGAEDALVKAVERIRS
jgi:uncharacterized protein YgbK (DUF1537 family)